MKKRVYILFFMAMQISFVINAQFIITEVDDLTKTPYEDYQVFLTNSTDLTRVSVSFDFRIKNTGTKPIEVKIQVVDMKNSSGDAEMCYAGFCTGPVYKGDIYPLGSNDHVIIQPGKIQPDANACKFANRDPGINPDLPVEYLLKFYEVNQEGKEIGTPLHVVYRYSKETTGVSDTDANESLVFNVFPTVSSNSVVIESDKNAELIISDVSGNVVNKQRVQRRRTEFDISDFRKGIYFFTLFDKNTGKVKTEKVIKL